jgi:hypothetical protein
MKQRDPSSTETHAGRRRWGCSQQGHIVDPYRWPRKPSEPAACPQCGAVYQEGRWCWANRPENAVELVCQACHRINDHFPAGVVRLSGAKLAQLKFDIIRLARHQEETERTEHPLNRIIDIHEESSGVTINTTDIHLPRRIGEAIERAYKGDLKIHFDKSGYFVRVDWTSPS